MVEWPLLDIWVCWVTAQTVDHGVNVLKFKVFQRQSLPQLSLEPNDVKRQHAEAQVILHKTGPKCRMVSMHLDKSLQV